jgi:hypothetical protein
VAESPAMLATASMAVHPVMSAYPSMSLASLPAAAAGGAAAGAMMQVGSRQAWCACCSCIAAAAAELVLPIQPWSVGVPCCGAPSSPTPLLTMTTALHCRCIAPAEVRQLAIRPPGPPVFQPGIQH